LTPTSTLANDISCKKKKSAQSEAVLNVALVVTKTPTAWWRHRPCKLHVWPRVLHLATSSLLQSLLLLHMALIYLIIYLLEHYLNYLFNRRSFIAEPSIRSCSSVYLHMTRTLLQKHCATKCEILLLFSSEQCIHAQILGPNMASVRAEL